MEKSYNKDEEHNLGLLSLDDSANPKQSKKKCERITFTVKNPIQIDYVIKVLKSEFDDTDKKSKYLYIIHDKDESTDGLIEPHLHAIVWGNPRRFVDWANQFSPVDDPDNAIPPHMICFCRNPRAMSRYLIHKDNKDKFQYSKDEVHGSANGLVYFEKSLVDSQNIDLTTELKDFHALRCGLMTPFEYLNKYRLFYSSDSFSNRNRLYSAVYENYKKTGDF